MEKCGCVSNTCCTASNMYNVSPHAATELRHDSIPAIVIDDAYGLNANTRPASSDSTLASHFYPTSKLLQARFTQCLFSSVQYNSQEISKMIDFTGCVNWQFEHFIVTETILTRDFQDIAAPLTVCSLWTRLATCHNPQLHFFILLSPCIFTYYSVTNKCTNINYFIVFINIDVFPYTCFGP